MSVDLNGRDPLVESSSSEWSRPPSSEGRRSSGRRRSRRRARKHNDVRARIRLRMWIACTGALIVMAVVLYLAMGRERPADESGVRLGGAPGSVAAVVVSAPPAA